ncbi:BREX system serine/threonine kinase PglW [Glycomyces salinus]|uniref:BREX system serine/threonine kinase PglW n=1 Tax=Glycomyces salinus TaxID=980294 RepID=UPI0018EBDE4C|nr:BREX system serine/threonine kinase PglW [Glycomyces salinus]
MQQRHWDGDDSEYSWEQEGLEHIRRHLDERNIPYYARQCFSFIPPSGTPRECDLLLAVPSGFYLLELKAHPGRLRNSGETWMFDGDKSRTIKNPLVATEKKAKELKGLLQRAAKGADVPFLKAAVFLSGRDLTCELDGFQRPGVYSREGRAAESGLPEIVSGLLDADPNPKRRTPRGFYELLPKLLHDIGVGRIRRERRAGPYRLESHALNSGRTWTDYLAHNPALTEDAPRRVRIYAVEAGPTSDQRTSMAQAAKREYRKIAGIDHPGIVRAETVVTVDGIGPGVVFQHGKDWQQLNHYMARDGQYLPTETRLQMIRQLTDALRHAHGSHVSHRALAAGSVWVSAEDGDPHLRIADWQASAGHSAKGTTAAWADLVDHINASSGPYLAPEAANEDADSVQLDVFGLGALSFLILTGKPPAESRGELVELLRRDGSLVPSAADDDMTPTMDQLVRQATCQALERFTDIGEFAEALDAVEAELRAAYEEPQPDPLRVAPGEKVGRYEVERILGSGSTGKALLCKDPDRDPDDDKHQVVVKVAIADSHAAADRLQIEADALKRSRSVRIAEYLEGPDEFGGRNVLVMTSAGEPTLDQYLRAQGRLTTKELEDWSDDLFRILKDLEDLEIFHRDIKPSNLGVKDQSRQHKPPRLVLFDFSLAGASPTDFDAGTRGYLDPFLEDRRKYDYAAERYAAAVTLHEMATGELPSWGDGLTAPAELPRTETVPQLRTDVFEPSLRDGLKRFFERALHRDAGKRFGSLPEMTEAFKEVFRDEARRERTSRPHTTTQITPDLELVATELSDRAIGVALERLDLSTVEDLIGCPASRINSLDGAGTKVKHELLRKASKWRAALGLTETTTAQPGEDDRRAADATVDQIADKLLPKRGEPEPLRRVALLLGLPHGGARSPVPVWSTFEEVAVATGESVANLRTSLDDVRASRWAKSVPELTALRDQIADILAERGRVMEASQLASAVLGLRSSEYTDPESRLAAAGAAVFGAVQVENALTDERCRYRMHRLGDGPVIVALTDRGDEDQPSDTDLFDYARDLGVAATRLVKLGENDPLPDPEEIIDALRSVEAPTESVVLSDRNLVRLAAGSSKTAAATRRLELYPVDLDPKRVVALSQLGIYLDNEGGVEWKHLRDRVNGRFGELERFPDKYSDLLDLLRECGIEVETVPDSKPQRIRLHENQRTGTQTATRSDTEHGDPARDLERTAKDLDAAVEQGGFRAIKASLRLTSAAAWLARRPGVRAVDLQAVFLGHLREYVAERGGKPPWETLLAADTDTPPSAFNKLLEKVWERVRAELLAEAEPPVLLLHNATPLARYEGGRRLLAELIEAARTPDTTPWGLWLLCPMASTNAPARLDDHEVHPQQFSGEQILLRAVNNTSLIVDETE